MKKFALLTLLLCCVVLVGCTKKAATNTNSLGADSGSTMTAEDLSALESLAECLTENNLRMYGTEWCGHCKNQKAMFGDAFAKVNYTDCDKDKPACVAAGIQGFPTWVDASGNQYPGTRELIDLASYAGCEFAGE